MKDIVINGRKFQYELVYDEYYSEITRFYDGVIITHRKKYFFFGRYIVIKEPKFVFSINLSIEDARYSKEQLIQYITPALNKYDRKIEIDNGDIL